MQPELIADYACACGEGPLWHAGERALYWVDIPAGRLFRYDYDAAKHEMVLEGPAIGGVTVQDDGALLLFMDKGAVKLLKDGELTTVIENIPDELETRFNDVIADPAGRVFCGTMPTKDRKGRLYRLDTDGTLTRVLDDIGCSNGMGFTPDGKSMYYTDSSKREIYLFDYNQATGEISNQRLFVRTADGEGVPDGMTVDAEGCVWTGKWDGGCAIRFSPDGTELERVVFPARKISCVTFGGPDYDEMYATTAGGNAKDTDGKDAGALFRVKVGVKGVPEFLSRIKVG